MPTIGIYVPMNVARRVAARYQITVEDEDFSELVRGICSAALEDDVAFEYPHLELDDNCDYSNFHQLGRRCRHCGGS